MTPSLSASFRRAAVTMVAVGVTALLALPGSSAVAAPGGVVDVHASDLASSRPAASAGWWSDVSNASVGVDALGPDGDTALALNLADTTSRAYVYRSFAAGERPTDIDALRAGASYTYAGPNVNFQFELVFRPADSSYGPNPTDPAAPGNDYCDSANVWGFTDVPETWCYTVLKWEPLAASAGWATVDLTADTAVDSSTGTGGWRSQKRIGTWPKVGAFSGSGTFSDYFAQIAEYEVTAIVVGAGSGTAGPTTARVSDITVGGVSYRFAAEPAAPAAPPAADSTALADLIDAEGIDVAADTAQFVPVGLANADISRVDPTLPFAGDFPWSEPSDAFVDVYSYSTASFLGTFAVVGGTVQLRGVDLSHLAGGTHHVLFRGQTSGALGVVQVTVLAAGGGAELAATGAPTGTIVVGLVSLAALLAGVGALILGRRQVARLAV
ncbi:hypothetical protein [Homoserinibacter gongjuensis]|uniref:LPXTG-motif cell wall anchor domain-containing protein n=1 Tax=Homoserinibacter gongjuensis TaxID=1162968 RepID=A0ABQ6JUT4_9MICO|nr:hypothetical protein [Homoserinibacter gongjuensis]GMA90490.1 hypothetical protein GCM10025869_10190 [Homoserinibacter gongjuensis]